MTSKPRLGGIDLFRGLAVYGVVLLHSDEPLKTSPLGWDSILEFVKFAVPFFLATAFYFNVQKTYTAENPFPLRSRLLRLAIPYGVWSLIYLGYKCLKYGAQHDFAKIRSILQDPFHLVFAGGAAFHLYFIPLLMAGTAIVWVMITLKQQQQNPWILLLFTALSLGLYQGIIATGNDFNNSDGMAFASWLGASLPHVTAINPILRGIAIFLAWCIRCLPYVTLALFISHPQIHPKILAWQGKALWISAIVFVAINGFGVALLPAALYEIFRGYLTFGFALFLSQKLPFQNWIKSLGTASFGIYLIHLIFVEAFYIIFGRLAPQWIAHISTVSLLSVSLIILCISWGITVGLNRIPRLSRLLFGV